MTDLPACNTADRRGRVVIASDCGVRGLRFESHRGRYVLTTADAIYTLGHGLCTFTQFFTLRGTVK